MNRFAIALTASFAVISTSYAGDLNPPAGPVAPTMKTLDEVEPSTPIQSLPGDATSQHVISEPGAYHLTGNLDLTSIGATGIRVLASGVNIDLRGFTIIGDRDETVPAIRSGILSTIRNGTIDNWGDVGISTGGHCVIENVQFDGISGAPIDTSSSTVIRDCHFRICGPIELGGETLIEGCLFRDMAEAVDAPGVRAISIIDCVIDGQNTSGTGHVITVGNDAKLTNVMVSNEGRGALLAGLRATVDGCTFSGNNTGANNGVTVSSGSIVRNCTVIDYGGSGIVTTFTSIIENNVVGSCAADGIRCTGNRNIVRNNNVSSNSDDGIEVDTVSRVENNQIAFNGDHGIEATSSNHIVGNSLDGDPIEILGDSNVVDSNNIAGTSGMFSVRLDGSNNRFSRNNIASSVFVLDSTNMTFTIRNAASATSAGPWDNFLLAP